MSNLSMSLDRRFQIKQNGSTVRTEILAGITTFATMSSRPFLTCLSRRGLSAAQSLRC